MLAGCLLVYLLPGCAQIIGIEDLPEIDAGQDDTGVQDDTDARSNDDVPPGRRLVPSHGATLSHLDGVTVALQVPEESTINVDTDTGEISFSQGAPVRRSGKGVLDGIGFFPLAEYGVAVVAVTAVSVAPEGSLSATGTRPLVLLSKGDVSIRGKVSVSAESFDPFGNPGAGGGSGAETANDQPTGCAPGQNGFGKGGGGGGGFRHHGGAGGDSQDGLGGAGGSLPCSQDLVELTGGSGGGAGGLDGTGGAGGHGGGAVQITSFTSIEIISEPDPGDWSMIRGIAARVYPSITGVFANGAGGDRGGGTFSDSDGGGGGGGSGGTILLEAPRIVIREAYVTANGGGGGGSSALSSAEAGDDGDPMGGSAFGGHGDAPGGDGGTGSIEPTAGADGIAIAGGGGGSAGAIHLHVPPDQLVIEGTVLSPEPSAHEPTWEE